MEPRKDKKKNGKGDNYVDFLDSKDNEVKDSPSEAVLVANLFAAIEDLPRGINTLPPLKLEQGITTSGPLDEADDGTYEHQTRLRDWKRYLALTKKGKEGVDDNKDMRRKVREMNKQGMTKINACWDQLKEHAKKNNLTASDIIAKHTPKMDKQKQRDLQAIITSFKKKIGSKSKYKVLTKRLTLLEEAMQETAQQRKLRKEARQHINNVANTLKSGSVQAVTLALTQFGEFINKKSQAQHKGPNFIKNEIAASPLWRKENLLGPKGTAIISAVDAVHSSKKGNDDKEKQKVVDSLGIGVSGFLQLTQQQKPEKPRIYAVSTAVTSTQQNGFKKPCIVILNFNKESHEVERFVEIDKDGKSFEMEIKQEDKAQFNRILQEQRKNVEKKETTPILLEGEFRKGLLPLIKSTKKAVIEKHSENVGQYVDNVLVVQTADRLKLEKLLGELEGYARQFLDPDESREAMGLVRELRDHARKYYAYPTIDDQQAYSTFKESCLKSISKVRPDTSEKAKAGFWQNLERLKLMIQLLMPAKLQTKDIQEKAPGRLSFLSTNRAFLKTVGEVKASIHENTNKLKR